MLRRKISTQACAVVTGAGSGIGRAFATELARRGGRVVCADIDAARAQETAGMIAAGGGKALALQCDVADLAAVEGLAVESERWLGGPVDLVINNAGVGVGGRNIGDVPIDDWRWTVGVNLWGVVHGCHVFAPRLRRLGQGGIVNVCSTASFAAAAQMGPYNVTKAAVLALSETLAAEMSGTGIVVTALCPTFVKTNIVRDARTPAATSKIAQRLMDWTGMAPERVAKTTLDALDRRQLYVLPQFDARLVWRLKRFTPVSYGRVAGLIGRIVARPAAS